MTVTIPLEDELLDEGDASGKGPVVVPPERDDIVVNEILVIAMVEDGCLLKREVEQHRTGQMSVLWE